MNGQALVLRYQRAALRRDYWRAVAGIGMTFLLLLLVNSGSLVFYVIMAVGAVFVAYAGHTCLKQSTVIELHGDAITRRFTAPLTGILRTQHISLAALDRFSLRYYGRRRDRGRGIVELTIGAGRERITADHALEEFDAVVKAARQAARARGLDLDPATEANLEALGYR